MAASANNPQSQTQIVYIYNLPYFVRTEVCRILDKNNEWEELAGVQMKFDELTIKNLRRELNPTDKLFDLWAGHNHTVSELFILLFYMRHYESMVLLKDFVDPKYYGLLEKARRHQRRTSANRQAGKDTKDLGIGTQNFNQVQSAPTDVPKVQLRDQSNHQQGAKILNRSPRQETDLPPSNSNNLLVATDPIQNGRGAAQDASKKNNLLNPSVADTALPQISYEELRKATNDWSKHTILGKGGFGTVFRGNWKNTQVAIKRIEKRGSDTNESYLIQLTQSLTELKILNAYRHDNILSLYAYSMGGEAPCLVYQCMTNGSLEDRLSSKQNAKFLNWMQRHEIAKGTARGLQFLHTIGSKPLIHGDIKSANILLDKNYEPKIGDFGLAREGPEKDYMKVSRVQGTRPYLPDEFLLGRNLSTKIDTYSYGIVLFELATGLGAYNDARPENKFLKDHVASCADKGLLFTLRDAKAGIENDQVFHNLVVLGKWCSNRLSKDRPEMVSVLQKLDDL